MAVEIRELLVRTTIEGSEPKAAKSTANGASEGSTPAPAEPSPKNDKMRDQLLKECVNMIMDNISSFTKER